MWKPATTPAPKPATKEHENVAVNVPSSIFVEPTPASKTALPGSQEQAAIGRSLVIKGEVSGSESLYIDGRVEGAINLAGSRVTVGRNGQVTANITAKEVVVLGRLKGNVSASDRVEIRNEGSLTGDVACQRICIEDGAYFKGGIDIQKANAKEMGSSPRVESSPLPSTRTPAVSA
jgi:cytoskeletal protein CcmA (bactofilin family)